MKKIILLIMALALTLLLTAADFSDYSIKSNGHKITVSNNKRCVEAIMVDAEGNRINLDDPANKKYRDVVLGSLSENINQTK